MFLLFWVSVGEARIPPNLGNDFEGCNRTRVSRPGMGALPSSDDPYGPSSDRTRLLAGTALLEDGSRGLMDSQRIALETEEQGADILRSLRGQREEIQNARDMLSRADTSIDRASMYQQRVVTAAIIVVLVLLIGIILWAKLLR